jgi:hypothetical protein
MNILNQFINSAVRQVGRNVANDAYYGSRSSTDKIYKLKNLICYSTQGYQEGDVEIRYDTLWSLEYQKWYVWPTVVIAGLIPYIGFIGPICFMPNLCRVFFKKYQMHFFNFEWNTYKVQDRRTKEGTKDIKVLDMVYNGQSCRDLPHLRNKIEAILLILIPLVLCYLTTISIK